jgi:hypothetical protein
MSASTPSDPDDDVRTTIDDLPPMVWLTPEESWEYFDQEAREIAGVSGEEFIRNVRAGEYHDIPDEPEYWDLIFLVQAVGRG